MRKQGFANQEVSLVEKNNGPYTGKPHGKEQHHVELCKVASFHCSLWLEFGLVHFDVQCGVVIAVDDLSVTKRTLGGNGVQIMGNQREPRVANDQHDSPTQPGHVECAVPPSSYVPGEMDPFISCSFFYQLRFSVSSTKGSANSQSLRSVLFRRKMAFAGTLIVKLIKMLVVSIPILCVTLT